MDELDQDLLLWGSGMHPVGMTCTVQGNICVYHHMKVFLDKYSFLQRNFDPFQMHKKKVRCSLREVDIKIVLKVNQCMGLNMKPGQKLCSRCVTLLKNEMYSGNVHESDEEYHPPSTTAADCSWFVMHEDKEGWEKTGPSMVEGNYKKLKRN